MNEDGPLVEAPIIYDLENRLSHLPIRRLTNTYLPLRGELDGARQRDGGWGLSSEAR